jgi:hypothetical protein
MGACHHPIVAVEGRSHRRQELSTQIGYAVVVDEQVIG